MHACLLMVPTTQVISLPVVPVVPHHSLLGWVELFDYPVEMCSCACVVCVRVCVHVYVCVCIHVFASHGLVQMTDAYSLLCNILYCEHISGNETENCTLVELHSLPLARNFTMGTLHCTHWLCLFPQLVTRLLPSVTPLQLQPTAGGGCRTCGSVEHKKADCPTALRQKQGDSTAGRYAACGCGTIDACSHGWTGSAGCWVV